ncbi:MULTISPECIES: dTMP kinase [unclassified Lysobacter]|uniref:dTMP kinase n=1 Tax=unclassified Lysobacter TaxID=2635362 RepID=UPI001BE6101D|nr:MULTISPECIES: dTMP kinase [unclassified Lysobacter]MBT2749251.1 dTMP kinase [Lysobacter sp. ISL-42]MBT2754277.1 dTMP kinase [Lysobacter sp. ISL-50]MBT2779276.1 dTMP kinase [Lysobacter sp. ISL-54]MBT2784732.1 dTMP kinase [Lysobacter sp. ISL-52]
MSLLTQPRLITLEGGEGAGKSTVLAALRGALEAAGIEAVYTREPGGTPLAEQIRGLMLDTHHEAAVAETELLLAFAARAQHVRATILPALQRGAWVVSDRFTDASYAYQGAGRGLDLDFIADLERRVVGIRPALTLLLDVPVEVGLQRMRGRGAADRIEGERNDFFERVRQGYRDRAAAEPQRFEVIDASQPADAVAAQAVARLRALLAATEAAR